MEYQGRCVICVVFIMSLRALELKQTLISLLFQVIRLLNYINRLWEAIWSWPVNMSAISYQIQKLVPQRIMVKTTWKTDHPWCAIFSVIVYWCTKDSPISQLWGTTKSILTALLTYESNERSRFTCSRRPNPKGKLFIKNHHFLLTIIFMTVFITGAPVEDNTVSECIRTVAATYGCKILQLYKYEAKSGWYSKNTSSRNIKDRKLSKRSLYALSGQYMFQN